jgi:ArsR family transcriptional regulator
MVGHYPGVMANIFDVLADDTRRSILRRLLDEGETTVGDLATSVGTTQPTASKHLTVLRDAGLVSVREDGRRRFYRVRAIPLREVDAWLAPFLAPGATLASSGSTIFAAWASVDMGDRVGRAAAGTAHSARVAVEAAQEKLQGAQRRVADKWPRWSQK